MVTIFNLPVYGINIHGLYLSSCERELGVIIRVEKTKLTILTVKGEFKEIQRHEIIYLTYYSIDSFPDVELTKQEPEDVVEIETVQNNHFAKLVEGWPIDYSEKDISFLTLDGLEVLISRENIWKISIKKPRKIISFRNRNKNHYRFVHPYPFRLCPPAGKESGGGGGKTLTVYPQQMLNDSVQIKIELDRLRNGRERIGQYNVYQQFYAVPQVYGNDTSLGYWFSYGSRYGASNSRSNNLTPILQNEFSTGIFGYQHLLLTGSAPMPYSVHEETQTQFYYRFKADYFHLGFMLDPSLFLVPWEKYKWKPGDFNRIDDGLNSSFALEIGLDYSSFTLEFHVDSLNVGVRTGSKGYYGSSGSFRFGTSYQNHFLRVEIQFDPFSFIDNSYIDVTEDARNEGEIIDEGIRFESQIGLARLNLETVYFREYRIMLSLLYRRIRLKKSYNGFEAGESFSATDEIKDQLFSYRSSSYTGALYFIRTMNNRYNLGGFAALELHDAEGTTRDGSDSQWKTYPKLGVYASLFF